MINRMFKGFLVWPYLHVMLTVRLTVNTRSNRDSIIQDSRSKNPRSDKSRSRKFISEKFRFQKSTILDEIVGTYSYVFFKVLKNFHNKELTCNFVSSVKPLSPSPPPPPPIPQINVVGQHVCQSSSQHNCNIEKGKGEEAAFSLPYGKFPI